MKKLLIILMVVAMASFLFVGCLGDGVTPPVDDDEEDEDEDVGVTATVAPVITAIAGLVITSSSTQYINATEAAVVIVEGTAPTYSEVKVYIDDVTAGTANVGDTGTFTVVVAEADLGADGDKVLYATAKEAALDVSAHSVEYAFILDQVAPGIDSVAATADGAAVLPDSAPLTGANPLASFTNNSTGTLVVGTWNVHILADSATTSNVRITPPTGLATTYTILGSAVVIDYIPGLTMAFINNFAVGASVDVVIASSTGVAVVDRFTLKFNEDVSTTGATAGAYAIYATGTVTTTAAGDPSTYKESNDTGYWDTLDAITVGQAVTFTVYGVTDAAGNAGGTSAAPLTKTCNAGVASATSLKP